MGQESEKVLADGRIIHQEIPLIGIRRMIANRMEESLRKAPQATLTAKADFSALIRLREKYLAAGLELTYTDLLIKLVGSALQKSPFLNATIEQEKMIQYKTINMGVAVGTERGLFVPVVKNVQEKSVQEISLDLQAFLRQIKEGTISSDAFTGGTFTLSNMGMFQVDVMTPILNYPEVAIMSIGSMRKEPVVDHDDTIQIKPMATISLTLNHAALDGLPAAKFIETVLTTIHEPETYL